MHKISILFNSEKQKHESINGLRSLVAWAEGMVYSKYDSHMPNPYIQKAKALLHFLDAAYEEKINVTREAQELSTPSDSQPSPSQS